MDIKLTELEVKNVYDSEDLRTISVAFVGRNAGSYQLKDLVEALVRKQEPETVSGLQAAGDYSSTKSVELGPGERSYENEQRSRDTWRDHASISTTQLEAKLGSLSFKFIKVYDVERDIQAVRRNRITLTDLQAAGDESQYELFDPQDDQGNTVYQLTAGGAVEYDYDEAAEVLDSLHDNTSHRGLTVSRLFAAGVTPRKYTGDLAQTSIMTANGQEQIIGLSEWSIDFKRKTVESTTTDDAGSERNLGSTTGWTAKIKLMFVDGDQSQVDAVMIAIDALSAPLTYNFFPTIESGRAAFQGSAIIDGITIASGLSKVVGLDVSLKGDGPLKRLVQAAPIANANTHTGQSAQV